MGREAGNLSFVHHWSSLVEMFIQNMRGNNIDVEANEAFITLRINLLKDCLISFRHYS